MNGASAAAASSTHSPNDYDLGDRSPVDDIFVADKAVGPVPAVRL